ncbi:MAG: MarR family transcriptional regulator [Archaeoglobaceae archaeon]|nr:MarR family transcriptional regulator [Archaeoglobaceae archaeon]MDW8117359.1 MarR family transcriptional regulator [Archaeoglobaceae archaeon]
MRAILVLILLILVSSNAFADTIYGKVYRWDTLEPIKAVVSIKNGFEQRTVAEDGSYTFEVEPGNYTIIARSGPLVAVENVTVKGKVLFDLILFPEIEINELPEIPEMEEVIEEDYSWLAIAISLTGIIFIYILKRRYSKKGSEKLSEDIEVIPDDLRAVIELIKAEGGRITQKELRKRLGYSEAKISLIIADLERRGLVEKMKKGRGNIIFLKTP